MKKTNFIEVKNIGEFTRFPIRKARQEFQAINKDGEEVERKREGTTSYFWIDDKGNRYAEKDVYYLIGKQKIQKVNRTEKVSNYEVVDKMEVLGLANKSTSILDYSETTLRNFEREVSEDKAVKFLMKLSSRGLKWVVAYVMKWERRLVMIESDDGIQVSQGIKEFTLMKQASSKVKRISQIIEIKADELEQEIGNLIKI